MTSIGLFTAAIGLALCATGKAPTSYQQQIMDWRKGEEAKLKAPESWLSVAGLYWMKPGQNTIGSNPSCSVALSITSVPAKIGTLMLMKDKAFFTAADGVKVLKNGNPFDSGDLKFDEEKLTVGEISFRVIKRGDRVGVRLYDPNSKAKKEFRGMKWFPVNEKYKVMAKFVAYPKGQTIPITNVLGDTQMSANPGYVLFTLNGVPCRLEAQEENGGLFLNFRDQTSGNSTYPAGRFLDTPAPSNGTVEIDFNKATNPPCAFTSFATCPLPPTGNSLPLKVEAGEKTHHPVE